MLHIICIRHIHYRCTSVLSILFAIIVDQKYNYCNTSCKCVLHCVYSTALWPYVNIHNKMFSGVH